MRTLAIIQARVGSSRLPGKVLAAVNNRPLLWYVVRRTQLAKRVDQVVVAVPDTVEDREIAKHCAAWDVPCIAGPEHDVLSRYALIADSWEPKPDVIVRITADCPLIDPQVIDSVVSLFDQPGCVYASNILPVRTFPDGLDVEAFPLITLAWLDKFALAAEREHVTAALHARTRLLLSVLGGSIRTLKLNTSIADARWTVDTAEDLEFVRGVFEYFRCPWDASMAEIIKRCRPHVQLAGGN
jgi:spore coat polysaccharide biosynthesis protein SpsF (cytidylyltransferase family)